jgi:hypothetical protein
MRHTLATTILLLFAAHPAFAEDDHSHGGHADRHVIGTVTSISQDAIELDTTEGEKNIALPDASKAESPAPEAQLKIGEQVTVHAGMNHDGTLEAHSIYRGRCGGMAKDCESQDLAWSHMHMMKSGRRMDHGMMKKHMHGEK